MPTPDQPEQTDFGRSANSSKKSETYDAPLGKVFDSTLKALGDIRFKIGSLDRKARKIESLTPASLEAKGEVLHIELVKGEKGVKVSIVSEFVHEGDRERLEDLRNRWNVQAVHKLIASRIAGRDTGGFDPVTAMRLASIVAIGTLAILMAAVLMDETTVMLLPTAAVIMTTVAFRIQRRDLKKGTYAAMVGTVVTLFAGVLLPFNLGAFALGLSFVAVASAWKAWLCYEWIERL